MSKEITGELWFLFQSLLLGGGIIILYDCLRILRRVIKHSRIIITGEDILYWIVCGLLIFRMFHNENDGVLRGFSAIGIVLGMLICQCTISKLLVKYLSLIINKVIEYIAKLIRLILKPFTFVGRKTGKVMYNTGKKGKKGVKNITKGLKKVLKTIRIGLCKH